MTREEAIAIIRKEYLCVDMDCDIERSCGKCDLMIPSKEPILQAYEMAIQALSSWKKYSDKLWKEAYEHGKAEALSQQPCDDATLKDIFCMGCEYREQEPINEKELNKAYTFGHNRGVKAYYNEQLCTVELPEAVFRYILSLVPTDKELPSVTQKSGKWIPIYQGDEIINYRCSECELGDTNGSTNLYGWDYCRRCGAKMIEPQESEDKE